MVGKKGMSPLIATILLMAFAVALGAVIMNWSVDIEAGGPDCGSVKLRIQQACIADGKVELSLKNIGEVNIAEVTLVITDPPVESKMTIANSRMGSGKELSVQLPFGFSSSSKVGLIPSLEVRGQAVACPAPLQEWDGLPNC